MANGGRNAQSDQQNRQMTEAMRQAINALQRSEEEMRKAVSDHDKTAEQRAAAQLAEAQSLLDNALHQQAGSSVSDMAQRAQEIANAQKEIANRLKADVRRAGFGGPMGRDRIAVRTEVRCRR